MLDYPEIPYNRWTIPYLIVCLALLAIQFVWVSLQLILALWPVWVVLLMWRFL